GVMDGSCRVRGFFFFMQISPQPISTLFPYTTLFRSFKGARESARRFCSTPGSWARRVGEGCDAEAETWVSEGRVFQDLRRSPPRSEEHTSELQSPCNLVCRLLLEKKKNFSKIVFGPT